eukprot:scaffold95639_cov66-Cyclotella_meneghiniana.AAC.1
MNGEARLRLEFIVCNSHHKPTFESWMGKMSVRNPNYPHQDYVCLDPMTQFTSAGLFQCLITSIMNDDARLRLEFIVCNGHHKLTFES